MRHSLMIRLMMAISILGISFGCISDDEDVVKEGLVVGDSIPDFVVTMNDGSVVTGSSLRKDVSLIMFFHTSCPDCQQILPIIQQIYDQYIPRGVKFAVISREEESSIIEEYWAEHGLQIPYSAQTDRTIYELFAKSRIPRIYINRDGIIRHIFTDNPVPTHEELKAALESQL